MAKVLVVGSRKVHDPGEFESGCRAIGAALAHAGRTIVAAGYGDDDAETWVMDGASSAQAPGRKTKIILFAPAVPGTQDHLTEAPGIAGLAESTLPAAVYNEGTWAVGQSVALTRSDVALLIGGGPLTGNVGSLALELGKPYYAVARLGGAAKALADDDYAKHRAMGMPEEWITPSPASAAFGANVVKACEFAMRNGRKGRHFATASSC